MSGDRRVSKIAIPRSREEASKIVIVGITFYELTSIRNLEKAEFPKSADLEVAPGRSALSGLPKFQDPGLATSRSGPLGKGEHHPARPLPATQSIHDPIYIGQGMCRDLTVNFSPAG